MNLRILPRFLLLVILPLVTFNLHAARQEFITGTPVEAYAGASRWLKENSPPGTLVFQTDWDDFNRLFFYNTHNVYSLGLDPSYMQLYNADLYNLWRETTQGWGNIGRVLKEDFGAAYAITDQQHFGFIDKAALDPYLDLVYEDEFARIYRVRAEPDPAKKGWYND